MGFITNAAALLNMEVNGVKGLKDRLLRHMCLQSHYISSSVLGLFLASYTFHVAFFK